MIDLKMRSFEPEFAGMMTFYLSAVNDLLRHPDDQPSIGLILRKTNDRFEKLKGSLPTIEELESELSSATGDAASI